MKTGTPLFLHEELMLLALRDDAGTIAGGTMYQYAVGGAALAELLLIERIEIDGSTKNKLVDAVGAKPVGEPFLDECLGRIRTAKRRASAATWVARFAGAKNLKHRVAEGLCERGILRRDEDTVLLLFSRRIYPARDGRIEKALVERLRHAIFTDTRHIEPRTAVLIALAHQTGLLKVAFDKKKLKTRKKRLQEIAAGNACGEATRSAIQAMQAAVLVCVIVPVIVS